MKIGSYGNKVGFESTMHFY